MRVVRLILISFLASASVWGEPRGEASASARIPGGSITRLQEELNAAGEGESAVEVRRTCKNIVRGAESLLKKYPTSPDRFLVLGIVFETQKILFSMRQSDEYREPLLETAKQLMEAPDEDAAVRVEAEILLLQLEHSRKESTPEDSALVIAGFADRYRNTPAEARSLIMASSLAFDLGNRMLLEAFRETLSKRFSDDPLVNAFMRERFAVSGDVHFGGEFTRADGKRVSFPIGQICLVCFWSLETPMLKEKVAEVRALQERYKGQFKVFSFNLDEQRDGGMTALKRMDLDWVPMRLPGGAANPAYLAAGGPDGFSVLVVGLHGLASTNATGRPPVSLHKNYEAVVAAARHPALLRSLSIGDFLVANSLTAGRTTLPQETLRDIRECFPAPPLRYRLTPDQELNNYEKAERLCGEAIKKHAAAPDLWRLLNSRMIALLGLWRLTGDSGYLEHAVASAKDALAMTLPVGAGIVPQFCIATQMLISDGADSAQVLTSFIAAAGGEQAPGSACAAALMLSLEAHSRDQYVKYRELLLNRYIEDPSAWQVASFLLDRSCSAALFEKALSGSAGNPPRDPEHHRLFKACFTTLGGAKVAFPGGVDGKMTAVAFMEAPADPSAAKLQQDVVDFMVRTVSDRPLQDMELIGVFRGDDTRRVSETMTRNKWTFEAACVPEHDWGLLGRQFGLVATDRCPNVFLIAPDGSILLALSGVSPDSERADTFTGRIEAALRDHGLALADKALARADYREYAAGLSMSFPLASRKRAKHESTWLATSAHRRKLVWACMKTQDWQRALDAVNINIGIPLESHNPKSARNSDWCRICYGPVYPMFVRAALLRKMGAEKQADEALLLTNGPKCPLGDDLDAIRADVERFIASRVAKNPRYSDPQALLDDYEKEMRRGCQDLHASSLEQDLLMRADIEEKLGRADAATADRRWAAAIAWPCPVRAYDPDLLHEASVRRRKLARTHLETGEWQPALEQLTANIEIHEAEALRCDSGCKICGAQAEGFRYRAKTQKELGRIKEAEDSLAMAEAAKCPTKEVRHSFPYFAINRMYGGGSGISRLNFIDDYMRGGSYANTNDRIHRLELAGDLEMRAQALEKLGEADKAAGDRKRAIALAYPMAPKMAAEGDALPQHYVDLFVTEDCEEKEEDEL